MFRAYLFAGASACQYILRQPRSRITKCEKLKALLSYDDDRLLRDNASPPCSLWILKCRRLRPTWSRKSTCGFLLPT